MPVTIPNTFVGQSTLQAADLDDNFTAIAAYSAAIPGNDIQAASISNAQLVNQYADLFIQLQFYGTQVIDAALPRYIGVIPGIDSEVASYTVERATYFINVPTGAHTTPTLKIEQGYYALGAWVQVGADIVNSVGPTIDALGYGSGALVVANATFTTQAAAATQSGFGLFVTNKGAMLAIDDFVCITLKLKRTGGLRS
jgi:hypothetical protein